MRPIVATVALAAILAGAVATWASGDEASSSEDYWLGPSFGGHALDETSGGSSFYGDCEPPPGEGGCGAPIEVQNATTCARNPLAIDLLPRRVSRVRGGGLAADYGEMIDVGTGRRTVTIFADERGLMVKAVRALRTRSQEVPPQRLTRPVHPKAALAELRRVVSAQRRLKNSRVVARATGLSRRAVRFRLRVAGLLGPDALRGIRAPRRSWKAVERDRQIAIQARELGVEVTARQFGISAAQIRAATRRVRGLIGRC